MAGIILIENDKRIRQQVQQLLKEIADDVQFAVFDSAEEFNQAFCTTTVNIKPFEADPLLKPFDEDEQKYLVETDLNSEPFYEIQLTFQKGGDVIESIEKPIDGKILGVERSQLIGQRLAFNALIPMFFRKRFENVLQNLKQNQLSTIYIPLAQQKVFNFVQVNMTLQPNERILCTVTNQNAKVASSLEIERKRQLEIRSNDKDKKAFSTIHLILFRTSCVPPKTLQWVESVFRTCKTMNYYPPDTVTHFVAMKYEDDGKQATDFIFPRIDDVIHLPIDRPLFLQKIDILLNLPKRTSPRFLFQQPAKIPIEISKRAVITKMSEVGVVLNNRVPLTEGILTSFYLKFPKESEPIHLHGKVLKNEKSEDQTYETYIAYIGLTTKQIKAIRKFLMSFAEYKALTKTDPKEFAFNPYDLFAEVEARRPRQILIVDSVEERLDHTAETIQKDLEQVKVIRESSYMRLLENYFGQNAKKNQRIAEPCTIDDLIIDRVCLVLKRAKLTVENFSVPLQEDTTFFGFKAKEFIGKDNFISLLFGDEDLEQIFRESLSLSEIQNPLFRLLTVKTAYSTTCSVYLKIEIKSPDHVELTFEIPPHELLQKRRKAEQKLDRIDALILDAAFLPEDSHSFITGFETTAREKNLLPENSQLNVIILTDEARMTDMRQFEHPSIRSVVTRPIDTKTLLFSISFWTKSEHTLYCFENIEWFPVQLPIHMAADILLEEISEFGATLCHKRPITPGVVLFLHKSIFDNAPGGMLAARFYRCEDHPNKKGFFLCSVMYFGISDHFTKFARAYFRENYALQKAKEA